MVKFLRWLQLFPEFQINLLLILAIDKIVNLIKVDAMSRLTIEIDPEQHRKIKTLATFAGMSLKDFILARTLMLQNTAPSDTTEELMASPKNADRLRQALSSPASSHRVFDSLEDLQNALGI